MRAHTHTQCLKIVNTLTESVWNKLLFEPFQHTLSKKEKKNSLVCTKKINKTILLVIFNETCK